MIELECDHCQSVLQVRDDWEEDAASCPKCGSSIAIPRPPELDRPRLLADATPEEMIGELQRRLRAAVLLLLDEKPAGDDPQQLVGLELGAENFDQLLLSQIYRQLADTAAKRIAPAREKNTLVEDDVFDLKGDRLGMSLIEFKQKHARPVFGTDRMAPWCSDDFPGQRIADLLAEAWHAAAGLVHARLDYPSENSSPTIAGLPTTLVLYQFVDGQLYQILAEFPPEAYPELVIALRTHFAEPVSDLETPRQLQWWTLDSTITLQQGALRPREPTVLSYYHDKLTNLARSRMCDRSVDL